MKKTMLLLTFILGLSAFGFGQRGAANDERKIHELIGKWDAAYRAMDGKAIAALETPYFELVDRFGDWHPFSSREENGQMWSWTFKNIYQGKPGPQHTIERIRFLNPKSAVVICKAFWAEIITLPDGTRIPPHGQTTTFTVVKNKEGWQIAAQTIHNKMPGDGPGGDDTTRDKLPWNQETPKPTK